MKDCKVTIERIVHGGNGLGYVNGQVIFVPFSVPGDELSVDVISFQKKVQWGEIKQIITPSPARVEPFCPHFTLCGGCQWQHISPDKQLEYKQLIVSDTLARLGGLRDVKVNSCLPSPMLQGYRHRVRFHGQRNGKEIGFYRPGSHTVVPIRSCQILSPEINRCLEQVSGFLVRHPIKGLTEIQFMQGSDSEVILTLMLRKMADISRIECFLEQLPLAGITVCTKSDRKNAWGAGSVSMKVAGREFQVSSGVFFQANPSLLPTLIKQVQKTLPTGNVGMELYSGVGVFSICLSHKIRKLINFELNPFACKNTIANLQTNKIRNVISYSLSAESGFELLSAREIKPDIVILDPPREGVSSAVCKALLKVMPKRIVYISCNPATLARDLKIILGSDRYQLMEIQPLDMFPHTSHIEIVTSLRAR